MGGKIWRRDRHSACLHYYCCIVAVLHSGCMPPLCISVDGLSLSSTCLLVALCFHNLHTSSAPCHTTVPPYPLPLWFARRRPLPPVRSEDGGGRHRLHGQDLRDVCNGVCTAFASGINRPNASFVAVKVGNIDPCMIHCTCVL